MSNTWTGSWPGVAGKSSLLGRTQMNRWVHCGKQRSALLSCWLATWQILWLRLFELLLDPKVHHSPMRKISIFWVRTIGFSPSIKSCCIWHQDATQVCKEKGSDLAVGWSKLWLTRSTSKLGCLMTTRRVSLIGSEGSVQPIH